MKKDILLVNCYREKAAEKIVGYRGWLEKAAAAHGAEVTARETAPGDAWPDPGDFSAVIVSGSQKMVGAGEVEPGLMRFLEWNRRPLLGVCYGHQALAAALGGRVLRDARKHLGEETVRIHDGSGIFAGFPPSFPMFESHEEVAARDGGLEESFRVLAWSGNGLVEAIGHRVHPFYGVQFHPERSGDLGVRLLANFLNLIP